MSFLKRNEPNSNVAVDKHLLWWQLAIQMLLFYVLYFMTTTGLRAIVESYSEWYSLILVFVYFFVVPRALNHFWWSKLAVER